MKLKPTREQQKIIDFINGEALVKAGAGCAKTTTAILRSGNLIETGVEPNSIVILTYSKELKLDINRALIKLLDEDVADQVVVMTIHAFAYHLVRHYEKEHELERSSVMKPEKSKCMLKAYAKTTKIKQSKLNKAFHYLETGRPHKVETILDAEQALLAKQAFDAYNKYKRKRNLVDFEDMIQVALDLLISEGPSLLMGYQHLMVDELQDINRSQRDFIIEMAKHMTSTVLVGDTHQSIYKWRHALPRYWTDLDNALEPKKFRLTETFRIPRQALPFINHLGKMIDKNAQGLRSSVDGYAPVLVECADQEVQYQWLVKRLKALSAKGVDNEKIVILAKTRKELSQTAIALRARDIGVTERYFPTNIDQHRAHLLALLQLTRLEKLRLAKSTKKLTLAQQELAKTYIDKLWLNQILIDVLQERLADKPKSILSVKSDNKHYGRINDLSKALKRAAQLSNVESAMQCLIDATKPVLKDRDDYHHKLLLRDLTGIKIKARACVTLDDVEDEWFNAPVEDARSSVQIMTVHSAKGREWDYVFLIHVVDGVYPHYGTKSKSLIDELRVFYVAVTRHHKQLYLLQTPIPIKLIGKKAKAKSGDTKPKEFNKSSPFIDIVNQGLVYRVAKKSAAN